MYLLFWPSKYVNQPPRDYLAFTSVCFRADGHNDISTRISLAYDASIANRLRHSPKLIPLEQAAESIWALEDTDEQAKACSTFSTGDT
jgi:hypothetical protein